MFDGFATTDLGADAAARFAMAAFVAEPDAATASFDEVYLLHAPLLRRIAVKKFGVPCADVDALVHDVFTTYLTNPANVRDVRPYLIAGICNAARQYWRRKRADDAIFIDTTDFQPVDRDTIDRVSLTLTLGATLTRLGGKCRESLRRYYLGEETTASIAESMNTSPAYVLQMLHTCRKRARDIYRTITRVP